ncbi:MAG: hypothetical protein R3Y62_06375, partial [Eubacteriales bacterium]
IKRVDFLADTAYTATATGLINFTSDTGASAAVAQESFLHLENGSIMALCDGVLFDFNDLSDNFINNYYITAQLPIAANGGEYVAETTSGSITFGDHLWKVSDSKYLIRSEQLSVHFSNDDVREVSNYVQISTTADGIVQILTEENIWSTISDSCYIETAGGVQIYPTTQLVQNGSYTMSMAKLSANIDDAIVLTEDETRRQIVPELNLESVDGEDGEAGEVGVNGTNGDAGTAGRTGTEGEAGEDGIIGTDGLSGDGGETGVSGTSGELGATGLAGESGDDGDKGSKGSSGSDGATGTAGSNGQIGKDASVETTVNSALPSMSVVEWNISATGLNFAVSISDTGGLLDGLSKSATVVITNLTTGEEIICYHSEQNSSNYEIGSDSEEGIPSTYMSDETVVYLGTLAEPLEADTKYNLSISGYYEANDIIFSREFLTRDFYTDSSGVSMAFNDSTTSTITVDVSIPDDAQSIDVVLLTSSQNDKYVLDSSSYTQLITISLVDNSTWQIADRTPGVSNSFSSGASVVSITFDSLDSNRNYICRTELTTTDYTQLLNSSLNVYTLKATPYKTDSTAVPTVIYNRTTGAFEVFRPTVTDSDGAVVNYIYTAYDASGNQVGISHTVSAANTSGESFYLSSGEYYYFNVTMEYYDNEKTVYVDLGDTSGIVATGDSMPTLTATGSDKATFNSWDGTININLGTNSSIEVDSGNTMTVLIYADQVAISRSITMTAFGTTATDTYGLSTASVTQGDTTNTYTIALDLDSLCANVTYTVEVYGNLNLGDSVEYINQLIGSVNFTTKDTNTISASWVDNTAEDSANMAVTLSLEPTFDATDAATDSYKAYVVEELQQGEVVLNLTSGSGNTSMLISTYTIPSADMEDLYDGTGVKITTSESFKSTNLPSGVSYTISIASITDDTCDVENVVGYVNEFDDIENSSISFSVAQQPPSLLTDPTAGVKVTEVLNKNVANYGGVYNSNLGDDEVVGYVLASTYNNELNLAYSVTYYAMEFNKFYNSVVADTDPIAQDLDDSFIKRVELPVNSGESTPPEIVLLFGSGTNNGALYAGRYVYNCGEVATITAPDGTLELQSGMGRGFRYIFAYTVEYTTDGDTANGKTYPYDSSEYTTYRDLYGVGGLGDNKVSMAKTKMYILNSGIYSVSRVLPEFYSYVAENEDYDGSRELVVHYTFNDVDGTINTTSATSPTQVTYGDTSLAINDTPLDNTYSNATNWYTMDFSYALNYNASDTISPVVEADLYQLDYDYLVTQGLFSEESNAVYLGNFPVEGNWEKGLESTYSSVTNLFSTSM